MTQCVMRITNFSVDAGTWFFKNCIYMKVGEKSDATKIKHVYDIEKTLNMGNIDSFLGINV